MANYFSVSIHTKPFLKKYLETLYGSPIIFQTDNYFGMSVAGLLDNPIEFHKTKAELRLRTDRYTTRLDIHCPMTFLTKRRFGFHISDQHTISLNKLFELRFEEDLYKFCLTYSIMGIDNKVAIDDFCRCYGIEIEDDISFEAIKKKEYRYRKELENRAPQMSRKKIASIQPAFL